MNPRKAPAGQPAIIEIKKSSAVVKIYPVQNRGKSLFMVTWFVAGARHRKNFTDEKEARREATSIPHKLSAGDLEVLSLKSTDRQSYLLARQLLSPLGVPLHDAIREYVAARGVLKGEPLLGAARFYMSHVHRKLPKKSIGEVVEEFKKIRAADGVSERYLQDIRSRLGRFACAFRMDLADVETLSIDEWLRSLKVSARSRKNVRILLVALFNFAKSCGYLPKDASTAADALSIPKVEHQEIGIYSVSEMERLLKSADQYTLPFLCLGGFAGLRSAEIKRLTWDRIRWTQDVIEIGAKQSKTAQRRLVPILSPLRAYLMRYANCSGPVIGNIKLHDRLRDIATQAGVKLKHNALRHSYASYRLAVRKNAAEVALEMGNSPRMIFQNYRELVTETDAVRWWNLFSSIDEKIVPISAGSTA